MHLSFHYPRTIDGIPAGGRVVQRFNVWTRAEIDIEEVPAADVRPACRLTERRPRRDGAGRAHSETVWHAVAGRPGVFRRLTGDDVADGLRNNLLARRLFRFYDDVPMHKVLEEEPRWRTVVKDHEAENELALTVAAQAFVASGGDVFVGTCEPYVTVSLDGHGRGMGIRIETHVEDPCCQNGYRLDRLDEAVADARRLGVTDALIELFLARHAVAVDLPELLCFDPERARVRWALSCVLAAHRSKVQEMPVEAMFAFAHLRDGLVGLAPGADLAAVSGHALRLLDTAAEFEVLGRRDEALIREVLLQRAATAAPEVLDDISILVP